MIRIDHTIFDSLYEEITSDYSSYDSITGSRGSGGVKGGNLLLNPNCSLDFILTTTYIWVIHQINFFRRL